MGVLLLLMLSHLPLLTHQLNNRWLLKGYSNIGFIMISAGILILLIIINILRLIQSLGRKHRRLRGLQYGKAVIKRSFWLLLLQILLYLLILPEYNNDSWYYAVSICICSWRSACDFLSQQPPAYSSPCDALDPVIYTGSAHSCPYLSHAQGKGGIRS